ncbi:hypothetical protein BJY04DRAFT_184303 [Aspergillus karnatakaensis]|uniref:uncharacterized protein n=1 Tax=Aspergillus karnatakaensis TaxID=1810916 RepID=UPI003CCD1C2C
MFETEELVPLYRSMSAHGAPSIRYPRCTARLYSGDPSAISIADKATWNLEADSDAVPVTSGFYGVVLGRSPYCYSLA